MLKIFKKAFNIEEAHVSWKEMEAQRTWEARDTPEAWETKEAQLHREPIGTMLPIRKPDPNWNIINLKDQIKRKPINGRGLKGVSSIVKCVEIVSKLRKHL